MRKERKMLGKGMLKDREKKKKRKDIIEKIGYFLVSIGITLFLFISVNGSKSTEGFSLPTDRTGTYVIEDVNVDYQYDEDNLEVVRLSNAPYVVLRGDQKDLNMLKWQGDPQFYIDLTGKTPGRYRENISYEGIPDDVDVEFSPSMVDLRIMEQETRVFEPKIDIVGGDELGEGYMVGLPEVVKKEVRVRDTQDILDRIRDVKAEIDVSEWEATRTVSVELVAVDEDGDIVEGANIIDPTIDVKVPVEKLTVVEDDGFISEREEGSGTNTEGSGESSGESGSVGNGESNGSDSGGVREPKDEKKGSISFIGVGDKEISILTRPEGLSKDIEVNVSSFGNGVYDMKVEGERLRFRVSVEEKKKEDNESNEDEKSEEDSNGDKEKKDNDSVEEEGSEDIKDSNNEGSEDKEGNKDNREEGNSGEKEGTDEGSEEDAVSVSGSSEGVVE